MSTLHGCPRPSDGKEGSIMRGSGYRHRLRGAGAVIGVSTLVIGLVDPGGASSLPSQAPTSLAVYTVTQEGMNVDQGSRLGQTFGTPNALQSDGSFSYADSLGFEHVPTTPAGEGTDKQGRPTVAQALDIAALQQLRPLPDEAALSRSATL